MFKNTFKLLLKSILVVFLGFAFSINAFAGGIIEENDSFEKAYSIGSWEYHESLIGKLATGTNEAYFTFMANSSDKVYIQTWSGLSIEIFNSYHQPVGINSDDVEYPTSFPYAKVDATSSYQTFYIKISRTTTTGNTYYSLNINNRIKSTTDTFDFIGTAYNSGNTNYFSNPLGVDSNIVSMDLINSSIPLKAVIKSITTSSHINTNLSGVYHKIYPTSKGIWYKSIVGSPKRGFYDIDLSNKLEVSQIWNFKYNFKGTSSSTMSNIKATIQYEYDVTDQY